MQVEAQDYRPLNATLVPREGFLGRILPPRDVAPQTELTAKVNQERNRPDLDQLQRQAEGAPEIVQGTKNTLARTLVLEYKAILGVMAEGGSLTPREQETRDTLTEVFKLTSGKGDAKNATTDELYDAFKTVMEDPKYIPTAIHIMSMQQEALQVATTVSSEIVERPGFWGPVRMDAEKRNYVPINMASDANGNMEASTPHNDGTWLERLVRAPLSAMTRTDAHGIQHRELERQGGMRKVMQHYTFFAREARYDPNRRVGATRDLTAVQKMYLKQMRNTGSLVAGEVLDETAQKEVAQTIDLMVNAKKNYNATKGITPTGAIINAVEVTADNRGTFTGVNEAPLPPAGAEERRNLKNRYEHDIEEDIISDPAERERLLEAMMKNIAKDTREKVENSLQVTVTGPVVESRIKLLEQQTKPRDLTAAEKLDIKKLDDMKAAYDADLVMVDQIDTAKATITKLTEAIKFVSGKIDADVIKFQGARPALLQDERTFTAEKDTLEGQQKRKVDEITRLSDQLSKGKAPNFAQINDRIKILTDELQIAFNGGKGIDEQVKEKKEELAKLAAKKTVEDELIAANQTLLNEKKQADIDLKDTQITIDRITAQLTRAKKIDGRTARYATPKNLASIRAEIALQQMQLPAEKQKMEAKAGADPYKSRELGVLNTFTTYVTGPDSNNHIQNRANQLSTDIGVSLLLDEAELIYPGMDRGYLRTMQIIFDNNVTLNTATNRELFQKGFKMLSPETFATLAAQNKPPITTAAAIDGDFIKNVLNHLHSGARDGSLGKLNPGIERYMQQLETVTPADAKKLRGDLKGEQETKLTAYEGQITDRKTTLGADIDARIAAGETFPQITTELNTIFFGGEAVLTANQVEQMHLTRTYDAFVPTQDRLREVAEIVTVNRENTRPDMFLEGVGQLLRNPALVTQIETRVQAGESIQSILNDASFTPVQKERLQKALAFAEATPTVLAGLAYILTPARFAALELGLRSGKNLIQTVKDFDPVSQALTLDFIKESARRLGPVSVANIRNNKGISTALKAYIVTLRPRLQGVGGTTDPLLTGMFEAVQGVDNTLSFEQVILKYANKYQYHEGSAEDIAARMLNSGEETDPAFAKMLAGQVIEFQKSNRYQPAITA